MELDKKAVIESFIEEYIYLPSEDYPHLRHIFSKDEEDRHFILTCIGWNKRRFAYYNVFHFELREDGVIIVHENRTDNTLDEWFEDRGIAPETLKAAWSIEMKEETLGIKIFD
ncbi:MAG: element excision factor XisI family protein [Bacteroidota bacterium]